MRAQNGGGGARVSRSVARRAVWRTRSANSAGCVSGAPWSAPATQISSASGMRSASHSAERRCRGPVADPYETTTGTDTSEGS